VRSRRCWKHRRPRLRTKEVSAPMNRASRLSQQSGFATARGAVKSVSFACRPLVPPFSFAYRQEP
jgi:hypothetical protein